MRQIGTLMLPQMEPLAHQLQAHNVFNRLAVLPVVVCIGLE
jgi:hypothetical protein